MCVCTHAANVINVIQEEKKLMSSFILRNHSNVLFWCEEKKFKDSIKYANPNCRKLKGCKKHLLINFLLFKTH